jgi:hypothetical protein
VGTNDPEVFRGKILANWVPIKGDKRGYTVVKFEVRGDGSFRNIKVESSDMTIGQQDRVVSAVLDSGPLFVMRQRTDKFASVKVYFDDGKITVETFHPMIYQGLDAVDSTDVKLKYGVEKSLPELR